jgi:hypothetical protein
VDEGRQRSLDYGFPPSMKAPSNALHFRAGVIPRQLESFGAHYYIGNTKIATMFASDGALGKRRWVALDDWAELDGCYLGANSGNSGESCGENRA